MCFCIVVLVFGVGVVVCDEFVFMCCKCFDDFWVVVV